MLNEKDIASGIRRGDGQAMRDFYTLYAAYLAGVCSRYIANNDDQRDVFQDSLLAVIQHIDSFSYRGAGSLKAWATRITVNKALLFLRNEKRMRFVDIGNSVGDIADEDIPATNDIPPDKIHDMIRQLPDGYRTVFNLYVIEGRSHKQIAETLGITETTSASQLHRAKALLAKKITEYRTKNDIRP